LSQSGIFIPSSQSSSEVSFFISVFGLISFVFQATASGVFFWTGSVGCFLTLSGTISTFVVSDIPSIFFFSTLIGSS
jgi:hypothetical protein